MNLLADREPYRVHLGDCVTHMADMPPQSVDFAIFSPPFPSVFSYTSLPEDMGNTEDLKSEAKLSFSFFFRQLVKVVKPGRVVCVHCTQIVRMKRDGWSGLYDFRGLLIRLGQRAGLIYDYDWLIRRAPQAQAIRTKSRALQFAGLESDRAQSRGANPDYIIKFLIPGDNKVPVDSENQITRNQWIEFAESYWTGISETHTLNTAEAKSEEDVRHICALQLGLIERLVRLYSNPGEIVFSPFAGIGSEGYESVKLKRRFYGIELKPEYHAASLVNLDRARKMLINTSKTFFDSMDDGDEPKPAMISGNGKAK